ncbi:hypothetical protein [Mycetocola tolaasinivorans]|uniref:hypothetical protein n=1 Tax=Mycetocola tolaasinivorans TaxID=76635 RepID=UPI0011C4488C|nr:hypothetical protein [Mycetocola tolaasinivorans]
MGDQQGGDAQLGEECAHALANRGQYIRRQRRERLIQYEQGGLGRERGGQRRPVTAQDEGPPTETVGVSFLGQLKPFSPNDPAREEIRV